MNTLKYLGEISPAALTPSHMCSHAEYGCCIVLYSVLVVPVDFGHFKY